jgi:hypothetical protein
MDKAVIVAIGLLGTLLLFGYIDSCTANVDGEDVLWVTKANPHEAAAMTIGPYNPLCDERMPLNYAEYIMKFEEADGETAQDITAEILDMEQDPSDPRRHKLDEAKVNEFGEAKFTRNTLHAVQPYYVVLHGEGIYDTATIFETPCSFNTSISNCTNISLNYTNPETFLYMRVGKFKEMYHSDIVYVNFTSKTVHNEEGTLIYTLFTEGPLWLELEGIEIGVEENSIQEATISIIDYKRNINSQYIRSIFIEKMVGRDLGLPSVNLVRAIDSEPIRILGIYTDFITNTNYLRQGDFSLYKFDIEFDSIEMSSRLYADEEPMELWFALDDLGGFNERDIDGGLKAKAEILKIIFTL